MLAHELSHRCAGTYSRQDLVIVAGQHWKFSIEHSVSVESRIEASIDDEFARGAIDTEQAYVLINWQLISCRSFGNDVWRHHSG